MTRVPPAAARLLALLAAAALATACSSTRFAREPQPVVDLTGHWVLEPAASDDAAAKIAAITPKPKPPPRPATATSGAPDPTGGNRTGSRRGQRGDSQGEARPMSQDVVPAWGRVRAGDFIAAFARPPTVLELAQQPGRVSFGSEERRRDFDAGDLQQHSVTDRYGSRRVSSGWEHDEFQILSQDGSRLRVLEHYRLRPGDRLETLVEFNAQGLHGLKVRSQYRRATPEEIAAARDNGPPAPASH
ncbi:MAG: hypothetical protein JSR73_18780 [Proteobacteria bacterium]|nr:hypothetical protein [Pseudomonadota bacterium]